MLCIFMGQFFWVVIMEIYAVGLFGGNVRGEKRRWGLDLRGIFWLKVFASFSFHFGF